MGKKIKSALQCLSCKHLFLFHFPDILKNRLGKEE